MRLLLALVLLSTANVAQSDLAKLQPKIDKAVEKAISLLLAAQYRDGSWEPHWQRFPTGQTALCAYSLLQAGLPDTHPAVQRAVAYFTSREDHMVYCAGLQLMALGLLLEQSNRKQKERKQRWDHMQRLVKALRGAQKNTFPYNMTKPGPRDLSLTQFALMGLWAAKRVKVRVDAKTWSEATAGVLELQGPRHERIVGDGITIAGFAYNKKQKRDKRFTGSMTAAGITSLAIARLNANKLPKQLARRSDDAVKLGKAWIGRHFSVTKNPGSRHRLFYYLLALERAASLTQTKTFGTHDWYLEGAKELIQKPNTWNRDVFRMCTVICFLRRATARMMETPVQNKVREAAERKRRLKTLPAGDPVKADDWMLDAARAWSRNLLSKLKDKDYEVSASSDQPSHSVDKAADGSEKTSWRWDPEDEKPWLELTFAKPLVASKLVLTNAASKKRDLGTLARAKRFLFSINGGHPLFGEMEADEWKPTLITLKSKKKVRSLKITVIEITKAPDKKAKQIGGFAEVALER